MRLRIDFVRRYLSSRYGLAGLIMFLVILTMALFAPVIAPYRPTDISYDVLMPPSKSHPFGTDHLGRDVFSRVVYGARVSITVGFVAAGLSALIGIIVGALSGYIGGIFDEVLSKIIDSFLMFPVFFLILIIVAVFGRNLIYIMLVIGVTTWPSNARIMRAQTMSLKEKAFIKIARATGESPARIIFTHIIPNGMYPVVANSAMQIGGAILTEAALSFLGLGDPSVVSWGKMINDARSYMFFAWWNIVFPGVFTVITVATFSFIGDGLQRALYPKLSEVRNE
ncbi:ABC transporter permease [Thermotoga sp. Ku-13t]|uniref:ABC transporter permease n=1 Tax=Thermotoga sp. Ku-13t TaxID=1755813 RepID=UPI0019D1FB32|nr:ABC transporter permease [Thermotoga sp. Ku-13t]